MDTPAKRLKAARALKGLNQVQLSKVTGIDQSTISDIENGKGLSAEYLMRLCEELDETPHHIMRGVKTDLSVLAQIKALVAKVPTGESITHNHVQGKTLLLLENKFAHTVVSVTDKDIKAIKGTTLNAERASISKTTKKQQD